MSIIISHPTGNANVRAAAKGLAKANLLALFYTSIAAFKGGALFRLGNISVFSEIHRRQFDLSLQGSTRMYPIHELGRIIATKFGWQKLIEHEKGLFCVDNIYQNLDKHIASHLENAKEKMLIDGVYAYEDGAAYSLMEAKRLGLKCYYDLPTGYWRAARKLLAAEIENYPEWSDTFTGFKDSVSKLKRKDHELALADVVFVASQFTASTLNDYPGKLPPVKIIPYGFPPVFKNREYIGFDKPRKLKLLFVGKLTQQKGIANLFDSIKGKEEFVELTIVGSKSANLEILENELEKHTYIPTLPHDEVLKLMRVHDVLVFPSLFDGFGMVITEAMSQGTPVIASERCAGPDLIAHGKNGWLMKAGSTSSLIEIIENLLKDPDTISHIGKSAMETARKRPWEVYGQELAHTISTMILK